MSEYGKKLSWNCLPSFQDAISSNTLYIFRRALRSTSHGCVFPFWVRHRRPTNRSRHARRRVLHSSLRAKVWRTTSRGRNCQTGRRLWVRNILKGCAYCRLDSCTISAFLMCFLCIPYETDMVFFCKLLPSKVSAGRCNEQCVQCLNKVVSNNNYIPWMSMQYSCI